MVAVFTRGADNALVRISHSLVGPIVVTTSLHAIVSSHPCGSMSPSPEHVVPRLDLFLPTLEDFPYSYNYDVWVCSKTSILADWNSLLGSALYIHVLIRHSSDGKILGCHTLRFLGS